MVDLVRLAFFHPAAAPTFLMGAAFPAIGAAFLENPRRTGRDTALIYGINTLGGMAGVLAAGFLDLPTGGPGVASRGRRVGLALAVIAWGAARRQPEGPRLAPPPHARSAGLRLSLSPPPQACGVHGHRRGRLLRPGV